MQACLQQYTAIYSNIRGKYEMEDACKLTEASNWRERMGVEPTWDIFMPPNGFEVRGAHRDSAAPKDID